MKRITAIATAIALPLVLSACGPTDSQTPTTGEPAASSTPAPSTSMEGSAPSTDAMSPSTPETTEPGAVESPNPGDAATGTDTTPADPNASQP